MLDICNAACNLHWPNVTYIKCRARTRNKFFSAHGVYLSRKPKQTHCGSHNKAWHSSGAMMSLMAVRVSILFMCTLDLLVSAEGVTGMAQQTIVWGWNLELRWRRALVSLVAAFVEVGCVLILLCSGRLAYMWQWQIGYIPQSTIFHNTYCQSRGCYVSLSYLLLYYQRHTGIYCINSLAICKGSTSSLFVLILFLSVYRKSFFCITFLLKNCLDFRPVVHYQ
jgi:hypothetical protein